MMRFRILDFRFWIRRSRFNICFYLTQCALLVALWASVEAQPQKVPRIGYLSPSVANRPTFTQGLRDLGYIEGKNIFIEWRANEGQLDRNHALAVELVRLKVDIIVAAGSGEIRAAKEATSAIPIVMVRGGDPVGSGFVASLARPGGNITGLATLRPELSGKRLELLNEILPNLSRVAVFASSTSADYGLVLKEVETAAKQIGVQLQWQDIRSPGDIERAFKEALKNRAEGVLFRVPGPSLSSHRPKIVSVASKSRLPVIYESAQEVDTGGLMSYGLNGNDLYRRAAVYVDKILKGAKPGDLPVEQPTKFDFIINLKAAKQIGLTIPPNVLARADRVIK
jgi:putative tryptophan/tyrosine transport system substrate-binding protein